MNKLTSRDIHRNIKNAISEIEAEANSKYICTNVEQIAEKAKVDVRTTRNHLGLLEEDGLGVFCDPKKRTFSTAKKLVDRIHGCSKNE